MDKLTQPSLVAMGGAAGALLRYFLSQIMPGVAQGFPWATLVANGAGCFLAAALFQLYPGSEAVRHLAIVGFCGGLTTFSAFSVETMMLFDRSLPMALVYSAASVGAGLAAVLLARHLF